MADDLIELLKCNFCSKRQDQVKKLIQGPGVLICDECIELCHAHLHKDEFTFLRNGEIPSPKKIKAFLDEYIIGQEYAKMVIAIAASNHYKRINDHNEDGIELEKSNILLIGPTASGKTLLCETVAKFLNVPMVIVDSTTISATGYVGSDVEEALARLLIKANYDVKKAERGIIFFDESDKKAKKSENMSITRDVSGEDVQQGMLKLIEGTECLVPPEGGRKHPHKETITVNTKNILFILGGAFVGLDTIIESRVNKSAGMGFGSNLADPNDHQNMYETLKQVEPEDLIKFGLIPELVSRLPIHVPLQELNEEQLVQILTEPKNAVVKQFIKLFSLEKVELEFTHDALKQIAKIALDRKTGARGLRSVIESRLIHTQFELAELYEAGVRKIIINKDCISNSTSPKLIYEKKAA